MASSIFHLGINFVADGVQSVVGAFNRLNSAYRYSSRSLDQSERQIIRSSNRIRDALGRDWASAYQQHLAMAPNRDAKVAAENFMRQFDREWRNISNKYQSMVMGSVALTMAGIGVKQAGMAITQGLTTALDSATEFELAMKQIEFFGGIKGEAMRAGKDVKTVLAQIQSDIMQMGIDMPLDPTSIAKNVVNAMKQGYSKIDEAKVMATAGAKLEFLSLGKLQAGEGLTFASQVRKMMGKSTSQKDMQEVSDMIVKTADISALDVDTIWKAVQSSRSAKSNLNLDNETFFALLAGVGGGLQARGAGESINVFSRGILQAFGAGMDKLKNPKAKNQRGTLWNALGIDLESEGKDMLAVIDKISKKSKELWGDTALRRQNLIDIFGNEALPLFNQYEMMLKDTGKTLVQLRDQLKNEKAGYSDKAMKVFTESMYGVREQTKSLTEQMKILFGLAIGPVFVKFLKAINSVLTKINQFIEAHPDLVRVIGTIFGAGGLLAIGVGTLTIFAGSIVGTIASIKAFIVNLVRNADVIHELSLGATNAGDVLRNNLGGGIKSATKWLGRMGMIGGLLYIGWKYDFLGMGTAINNFAKNVKRSSEYTGKAMDKFRNGSLSEFIFIYDGLIKGNKLAEFFVMMTALFEGLSDAWSDNTMSEDTLKKVDKAGALPLLNTLLDLKYAVTEFFKGLDSGIKLVFDGIKKIGDGISWAFGKLGEFASFIGLDGLANKLSGISDLFKLENGVTTNWQFLGKVVGIVVGVFVAWKLAMLTIVKPLSIVSKLVMGLGRGIKKIGGKFFGGRGGSNPNFPDMGPDSTANPRPRNRYEAAKESIRRTYRKMTGRSYVRGATSLPIDYGTNPQRYRGTLGQEVDTNTRYRNRTQIGRRGTDSRLVGQGLRGRIADMLYGREMMTSTDRQGRTTIRGTDSRGRTRFRTASASEVGSMRGGRMRTGRGLMRMFGNPSFGNMGRGLLGMFRNIPIKNIGKSLFGGLVKVGGFLLKKGLPFIFKLGLRAIPFLGWAIMAWDAIVLIFTNWDTIKEYAGKAWNWIKTSGVEYLSQFWTWLTDTALPTAWAGIKTGFSSAWEWIKTDGVKYFGQFFSWLGDKFVSLGSSLWSGIKFVGTKIGDMFSGIWGWIKQLLTFEMKVPDWVPYYGGNVYKIGITGVENVSRPVLEQGPLQGPMLPKSHTGSKVTKDGLVNLQAGEVVLRHNTVKEFENAVSSMRKSNTTSTTPTQSTVVNFGQGSIQITMANSSSAEIERSAKELFDKFKRMVEADNMRNYQSARARG